MHNQLKELTNYQKFGAKMLHTEKTEVRYRHKTNRDEVISEAAIKSAWEQNLNPLDYEREVVTTTYGKELKKVLFGSEDYEVTIDDYQLAKLRFNLTEQLMDNNSTVFKAEKAKVYSRLNSIRNGNSNQPLYDTMAEYIAVHDKFEMPRPHMKEFQTMTDEQKQVLEEMVKQKLAALIEAAQ